jgi:hypothetical protein
MSERPQLKPGEFWGRCILVMPHPISELPMYLRREYEERGWKKGHREAMVKRKRRMTECYLEPLCDGFETTDKAAFEQHMREVHGRKQVTGEWETFSKSIRRGWVSPRPGREGAPLKKAIVEGTVTCEGCGLVMERADTLASERFVREHLELCVSRVGVA